MSVGMAASLGLATAVTHAFSRCNMSQPLAVSCQRTRRASIIRRPRRHCGSAAREGTGATATGHAGTRVLLGGSPCPMHRQHASAQHLTPSPSGRAHLFVDADNIRARAATEDDTDGGLAHDADGAALGRTVRVEQRLDLRMDLDATVRRVDPNTPAGR